MKVIGPTSTVADADDGSSGCGRHPSSCDVPMGGYEYRGSSDGRAKVDRATGRVDRRARRGGANDWAERSTLSTFLSCVVYRGRAPFTTAWVRRRRPALADVALQTLEWRFLQIFRLLAVSVNSHHRYSSIMLIHTRYYLKCHLHVLFDEMERKTKKLCHKKTLMCQTDKRTNLLRWQQQCLMTRAKKLKATG